MASDAVAAVARIAQGKPGSLWEDLHVSLDRFSSEVLDARLPRPYQVDIAHEAVFPYVHELTARVHGSVDRFRELQMVLAILARSGPAYHALAQLDAAVADIVRPSTLAARLEAAVHRQWGPILANHRQSLRHLGTKFLCLGLLLGHWVGPLLAVIPLLAGAAEATGQLCEAVRGRRSCWRGPAAAAVSGWVKAGCAVAVLWALARALHPHSWVAKDCVVLGVAAWAVSATDTFAKPSLPLLAPLVALLATLEAYLVMALRLADQLVGQAFGVSLRAGEARLLRVDPDRVAGHIEQPADVGSPRRASGFGDAFNAQQVFHAVLARLLAPGGGAELVGAAAGAVRNALPSVFKAVAEAVVVEALTPRRHAAALGAGEVPASGAERALGPVRGDATSGGGAAPRRGGPSNGLEWRSAADNVAQPKSGSGRRVRQAASKSLREEEVEEDEEEVDAQPRSARGRRAGAKASKPQRAVAVAAADDDDDADAVDESPSKSVGGRRSTRLSNNRIHS